MITPTYFAPHGGMPGQKELMTSRAVVTEAYTVIPRGVLRDIVTTVLPEWQGTRSWVLSRPVAGGAVTFSQTILEVSPGGGPRRPSPRPRSKASSSSWRARSASLLLARPTR